MTHEVTLSSFDELARYFSPGEQRPAAPMESEPLTSDLDIAARLRDITAEQQRTKATLTTIARRVEEARKQAMSDLERYDTLIDQQRQAKAALAEAQELLAGAESIKEIALHDEALESLDNVMAIAQRNDEAAAELVLCIQTQVEAVSADIDIDRLLKVRHQMEEQEKAKAAQAERAERLAVALRRASSALDLGRAEEAKAALEPFGTESPVDAQVASLLHRIAQAELEVKVEKAEDALWDARRAYHRDAASALTRLEELDVDGLPQDLAGQVFGQWAKSCGRVCRERDISEPLRYSAALGHGAVLTRHESGAYQVVSAIGMGERWKSGALVGERYGRCARPLV